MLVSTSYTSWEVGETVVTKCWVWMFDLKKKTCNSSIPNWRWRRWCGWRVRRWPSEVARRSGWVGFPRASTSPRTWPQVGWSDVDQSQGCAAEEGRLLLDLCYRTHNAGDAQEEAPLFVTDRSVRIGVGKPVPLVCGSTGKTGEWVTKPPAALFGCVGAGHRNAATARGI